MTWCSITAIQLPLSLPFTTSLVNVVTYESDCCQTLHESCVCVDVFMNAVAKLAPREVFRLHRELYLKHSLAETVIHCIFIAVVCMGLYTRQLYSPLNGRKEKK